jgi:RES domain-containing protein
VVPFKGDVLRSVPDQPGADPLDSRYAGLAAGNRWNDSGVPAVYFASTWETSVAEYGRNLDGSGLGRGGRNRRAVFRIGVTLSAILDLTDPNVGPLRAQLLGDS